LWGGASKNEEAGIVEILRLVKTTEFPMGATWSYIYFPKSHDLPTIVGPHAIADTSYGGCSEYSNRYRKYCDALKVGILILVI
jgi:hypothetical protein